MGRILPRVKGPSSEKDSDRGAGTLFADDVAHITSNVIHARAGVKRCGRDKGATEGKES